MNAVTKGAALLTLLCALAAAPVQAQLVDAYSTTVEWRQPLGFEVTPIHVVMLPTGKLLFITNYNYFENPGMNLRQPGFEVEFAYVMDTTPANAPPPASVMIQPMANPPPLGSRYDALTNTLHVKTLSCSGHALTADGKLFIASGPDGTVDMTLYTSGALSAALRVDGLVETFSLDPVTLAWTRHADMVVPGPVTARPRRWYATVTRLADMRMLVTGGYEKVLPNLLPNTSVEVFDPASNSFSAVSSVAETPAGVENPDYPHVFQVPYEHPGGIRTLIIGGSGEPMFLDLVGSGKAWTRTQNFRPGARAIIDAAAPTMAHPNHGTSSALLPIRLPGSGWGYANGSVIQVGGWAHTRMQEQVDVYDPIANAWRPTMQLNARRVHPSTIILPDGRILILGGHDGMSAVEQTGYAEYVDPRNNFALSRGTAFMPEVRAYHTVTVLLPDGRVLIGSGNVDHNDGREWTTFRYYSPDYMFKARPRLTHAQSGITMGEPFVAVVPHGTRIADAALVGLGAQTHSYDMNQRHVQLATGGTQLVMRARPGRMSPSTAQECAADPGSCFDVHVFQAPANAETAPPGDYMLFILDPDRVPSEGQFVKLAPAGSPPPVTWPMATP